MASQSLYRKWRSQTFADLVGQESVVRTLKNALNSGKLAHAYLFTGPRGTGKTTTARLLAKTINCLNPVNDEPCNKCEQCREITAGNSFNVIEIDAASNRGIDSIRDLREKVMMPPSTGKYKVYVLDEAHMLTTEAFNALLKTLEEPPPYAIFVMATTDVHKMLPTVLSRCQRFDFKRITTRQIVKHLNFVAEQEHVKVERAAAELIARAAAGGMRDALSLLDQAIAYSGTEISLAQVQAMLGLADPSAIQKLITHVAQLDSSTGLHLIHELSEAGADLRQMNLQIGEYWRALMLAKAGADIATILDRTEDETREIVQMTAFFGLEELIEYARIFVQNDLVQKNQGTPQLGLELAFLQCVELHRRSQPAQPARIPTNLSGSRGEHLRTPTMDEQPHPDRDNLSSINDSAEELATTLAGTPTARDIGSENGNAPVPVGSIQSSLSLQQVKDAWDNIKKRVKQKDASTAAMLNDYTAIDVEGTADEAIVVIQAVHDLHYNYVREKDRYKHAEWALSTEFRQACRVRLVPPGQSVPLAPQRVSNNHSASNAAMPVAPQRSARRERPAAEPQSPSLSKTVEQDASPEPAEEQTSSIDESPEVDQSSSIVKKNFVRENITTGTSQPSEETIEQKASNDPVVKEVVKTFMARIVDIRPK